VKPIRIQLSRKKGWRKPDNTVVVSRPSRWGNPFAIAKERGLWWVLDTISLEDWSFQTEAEARRDAVHRFRRWLYTQRRSANLVPMLRGKNLACWCPLDKPCHADVLLELANKEGGAQ
jgi:hypothetical protein